MLTELCAVTYSSGMHGQARPRRWLTPETGELVEMARSSRPATRFQVNIIVVKTQTLTKRTSFSCCYAAVESAAIVFNHWYWQALHCSQFLSFAQLYLCCASHPKCQDNRLVIDFVRITPRVKHNIRSICFFVQEPPVSQRTLLLL